MKKIKIENKEHDSRTKLIYSGKKIRILISIISQGQKERWNDFNVFILYREWSTQYKHFSECSKGTFTFVHLIVFKIHLKIKIYKCWILFNDLNVEVFSKGVPVSAINFEMHQK